MNASSVASDLISTTSVEVNLATVVVNLLLAAILAYCLRWIYIRYGNSLSNRSLFANNFVLLACTTMLIITVVKSSLALSLGLVGALSIVRFRSAIKEPEELAYLFLTIAIGLGLGADQRGVTLVAFAVIAGLILLGGFMKKSQHGQNLFLTIGTNQPGSARLDDIVQILKANCTSLNLRRFDQRPDALEVSFQVELDDLQQLENSKAQLLALSDSVQVSFMDNQGIL